SQHRGLDVNDHLIALTRRTWLDSAMQCRLGDQCQRVGLLLLHGWRLRRAIDDRRSRWNVTLPTLVERLPSCRQRLHHDRADLRLEPPPNYDHAVAIRIHVERAVPVTPRAFLGFSFAVHLPPAADDHLDVFRGAGPPNGEQPLLWRAHG